MKEPARAIIKFKPKANASSLPLNHLATAVLIATIIDSAPRPNTKRPVAMVIKLPFVAVMIPPVIIRIQNNKVAFLVPILSIMIPPISTIIILGRL